jgi:hypothetical protein
VIAMTDIDGLVASENNRRTASGQPPLSPREELEFRTLQILPCATCNHWRGDRVRIALAAFYLGFTAKPELETLQKFCCKVPETFGGATLTYEKLSEPAARRWR